VLQLALPSETKRCAIANRSKGRGPAFIDDMHLVHGVRSNILK